MNSPTLESVAQELATWRATRTKRGPIPDDLRAKIGTLPSRYRYIQIMETLRLNTAQIKLFSQIKIVPKQINPPIEFVRITPPSVMATTGIACEIKRPDGSTLQCTIPSSDFYTIMGVFLCSH